MFNVVDVQSQLDTLWSKGASAESQTLLGNGKTWGHPKPRQGGFAPWTPKPYLSCFRASPRGLGWHPHDIVIHKCGSAPICCMKPRTSSSSLSSTILSFSIRKMLIPVNVTCLPVGGLPANGPVLVPRPVQRVTTLSPSAMVSSSVNCMSGEAARTVVTHRLRPCGPFICPLGV